MAIEQLPTPAGGGTILFLPNDDLIAFDATLDEQHRRSALLTSHPVQDGLDINDNFRKDPKTLNLRCVFTDTPFVVNEATPQDRAIGLYNRLIEIYDAGTILEAVTALEVHRDMVITNITAPYSQDTGAAVIVDVTLQQYRIANALQIDAPTVVDPKSRDASSKDGGKQSGREVDPDQRPTYLKKGNDFIEEKYGFSISGEMGAGAAALLGR